MDDIALDRVELPVVADVYRMLPFRDHHGTDSPRRTLLSARALGLISPQYRLPGKTSPRLRTNPQADRVAKAQIRVVFF